MKKIIFIPFLVRALLKTLMLTAVIVTCNISVFAQLKNKSKQIPEGIWVLDEEFIQASRAGCSHGSSGEHIHTQRPTNIDIDSLDIKLYTELQVKQDSMVLISPNGSVRVKYTFDDTNGIRFDSPTAPFSPGGNVFADRLYVQQQVADPLDEADLVYVSLIYVYKNKF